MYFLLILNHENFHFQFLQNMDTPLLVVFLAQSVENIYRYFLLKSNLHVPVFNGQRHKINLPVCGPFSEHINFLTRFDNL